MKMFIRILAVVLAIGAIAEITTTFVAQASTEGKSKTDGGHEPGP